MGLRKTKDRTCGKWDRGRNRRRRKRGIKK
jgi:hypothetical protein